LRRYNICRMSESRIGESGMVPAPGARERLSLGARLGAASGRGFRLLRGKPGRNQKLLSAARAGLAGFAKPVRSALRILFLEVSGVVFLCFSLTVAAAFFHEYHKYTMHEEGWGRVALAGSVGAMFLYFGVTSFWRARRKRSKAR